MATPLGCITVESNNFRKVNAADAAVLGLIEVFTLTSKNGKTFNVFKANGLGGFTRVAPGIYASLGAAISIQPRPRDKWFVRDDGSVIACDAVLWAAIPAEAAEEGSVLDAVYSFNKVAQAAVQKEATTVELPTE